MTLTPLESWALIVGMVVAVFGGSWLVSVFATQKEAYRLRKEKRWESERTSRSRFHHRRRGEEK